MFKKQGAFSFSNAERYHSKKPGGLQFNLLQLLSVLEAEMLAKIILERLPC